MNLSGFYALFGKEVLRFWKVSLQTVMAPIITSLLYLMIFAHTLGKSTTAFDGVPYAHFLLPGLVMMSMLQNAFANTSSSLIQSKITGNLVFILLPPLSPLTLLSAYVAAAVVRGMVVGAGVFAVTLWFIPLHLPHPLWAIVFGLLGCIMLGTLGLIAGIWAEKFDQLAGFQNFLIMPLTFLAGVFYSIHSLPPFWQMASHFNPFFYLIDGFRYGFVGASDYPPVQSLLLVALVTTLLSAFALYWLRIGYKIRH